MTRVPIVPFEGRMSYCLTKCLKMVLEFRGDAYDLPFLECVSAEPFGFVYVRRKTGGLAINGHEYDRAGERLLSLLNYQFEVTSSPDQEAALSSLRAALKNGPVVLGMLDMGFLTYQPDHRQTRGMDHAIVALAMRGETLVVHDPAGYVNAKLPLADLLKSWKAETIYTRKSYMLWKIGTKGPSVPRDELFRKALLFGLENLRRESERYDGVELLCGPEALRTLAADVRSGLAAKWLKKYAYFPLRVSGQRCFDSAVFIRQCPFQNEYLVQASQLRFAQAEHYGEAQWAAATEQPALLADTIDKLADAEAAFAALLAYGLRGAA